MLADWRIRNPPKKPAKGPRQPREPVGKSPPPKASVSDTGPVPDWLTAFGVR